MVNITEANLILEQIADELPAKILELVKVQQKYDLRFWDLILHSGMGNQAAREAEANLVCQEEGLLVPVQNLKGEVKALYNKKDCYTEIARNLRVLQVGRNMNEEIEL